MLSCSKERQKVHFLNCEPWKSAWSTRESPAGFRRIHKVNEIDTGREGSRRRHRNFFVCNVEIFTSRWLQGIPCETVRAGRSQRGWPSGAPAVMETNESCTCLSHFLPRLSALVRKVRPDGAAHEQSRLPLERKSCLPSHPRARCLRRAQPSLACKEFLRCQD